MLATHRALLSALPESSYRKPGYTSQLELAFANTQRAIFVPPERATGKYVRDKQSFLEMKAGATPIAMMTAYDAELLRMKRDGRLKAIYDKYGIPYIEP